MAEQETQNILAAQELPVEENSEQNNPLAFLDEKHKRAKEKNLELLKNYYLAKLMALRLQKNLILQQDKLET